MWRKWCKSEAGIINEKFQQTTETLKNYTVSLVAAVCLSSNPFMHQDSNTKPALVERQYQKDF